MNLFSWKLFGVEKNEMAFIFRQFTKCIFHAIIWHDRQFWVRRPLSEVAFQLQEILSSSKITFSQLVSCWNLVRMSMQINPRNSVECGFEKTNAIVTRMGIILQLFPPSLDVCFWFSGHSEFWEFLFILVLLCEISSYYAKQSLVLGSSFNSVIV